MEKSFNNKFLSWEKSYILYSSIKIQWKYNKLVIFKVFNLKSSDISIYL